jgi:hypothetical protein
MSVFRPAARVTAPGGRQWELYVFKVEFRSRGGGRRLRRLASAFAHAVGALRGDTWTIHAISHLPQPQSYRWQTTGEHRRHVLAQVEGSFAAGHVPQNLRHATYLGWRRSAR